MYICVNITGGAMGFTPQEIFGSGNEYGSVKDCATRWSCFSKELNVRQAAAFSALWHNSKAYAELNTLHTKQGGFDHA